MDTDILTEPMAAAELYVRKLRAMGVIDSAWRPWDSTVVRATTHGLGAHLGNLAVDYDADVHIICDSDGMDLPDVDSLSEEIEEHGPIYFNVLVHGVSDEPEGYALPTHEASKRGADVREDLDTELQRIADTAGIDLGGRYEVPSDGV
jgi:hypothetical protein